MVASFLKPFKEPLTNRRLTGLNTIFMEKITELLSTSDVPSLLAGCGLEITRTHVQKGLTAIHVYWISSDPAHDERVNELLVKTSSSIRYELTVQQVLGKIPPIMFIRDSAYNNASEVAKLLEQADFGADFEPSSLVHGLNLSVSALPKKISQDVMERVEAAELGPEGPSMGPEVPSLIPSFLRQDVFGVNRGRIMQQVRLSRKTGKLYGYLPPTSGPAPPTFGLAPPTSGFAPPTSGFAPPTSFTRTAEIRKWVKSYKKRQLKNAKILKNAANEQLTLVPQFEEEDEEEEEEEEEGEGEGEGEEEEGERFADLEEEEWENGRDENGYAEEG